MSTTTRSIILDPTEVELGISVYLTNKDGFSGVLKARYSDFVVHEVGLDGSVSRLDCMEPKLLETTQQVDINVVDEAATTSSPMTKKQKIDEDAAIEESMVTVVNAPSLDWEEIQKELQELVGPDSAQSTVAFLQKSSSAAASETSSSEGKEFTLLPASSKDVRKSLHEWIRLRLEPVARSDYADGCVRIWHKRYEHKMPTYKLFDKNNHRHKPNNTNKQQQHSYLQFVLYKENMDTGAAIRQVQQQQHPSSSHHRQRHQHSRNNQKLRVGYAGMKDKRGITSQFVTVSLDGQGGRRDDAKSGAVVPKLVEDLCRRWNNPNNNSGVSGGGHTQTRGVGVIRVGNFCRVPHELRLGCLRGNRFDIVLRNLQGDIAVVEEAARKFRSSGFINFFGVQRFGMYHDNHLVGMAVLRGDYEAAVDIMLSPKADEPEQVNQARIEWQKRFENAVDRASAERDCSRQMMKVFGRYMHAELAVLQSLARNPLDYKLAFRPIIKTTRMMFLHALQSFLWNHAASHRVENMGHSPVKGDLVYVDSSRESVENKKVRVVTDSDIAASRYTLEDVVLPLIGTTTVDPGNECKAVYDTLLMNRGLSREMFPQLNDRDLDVSGDYRKLICHPKDVDFEVLHYSDPLQPLVQTDLMRLQGIDVEAHPQGTDHSLHAIRIGFTLPSSSYATIALRELMNRPTSSAYQSELKLGNQEEGSPAQQDGDDDE